MVCEILMLVEGSKKAAPCPVRLLQYEALKGADDCNVHVVGGVNAVGGAATGACQRGQCNSLWA